MRIWIKILLILYKIWFYLTVANFLLMEYVAEKIKKLDPEKLQNEEYLRIYF